MSERRIRLVVEAVVDGERAELCGEDCPCMIDGIAGDGEVKVFCGAFGEYLCDIGFEAKRCPACLSAELHSATGEQAGGG